jgi:DNA-binding NarL/FixJ family response regulator
MIRVLIAASDPLLRESLRKMLESDPDYQLAGLARDGQEAIQLAHSLRPDIALLSAQMSVYDGWQTTEFLMHASSPPDVVLLSEQGTDLRKAMRAGARDLLAWPCTAEVLLPSLQSVAGQKAPSAIPQRSQSDRDCSTSEPASCPQTARCHRQSHSAAANGLFPAPRSQSPNTQE